MLKVFLVEDEFIIREAIRKTINWEREGYELAGEAGDGERAYPMILDKKPDILITDIRMPFMDGLTLSRLVRENLPATKIIILSGYDDFTYAKDAISIGVAEYLLKPVSGAQLLESMKKVSELIAEEREQSGYREIYEAEHAERLKLERGRFLKEVIGGKMSTEEILNKSRALGLKMTAPWYEIMLFQCRQPEDGEKAENTPNPADLFQERISSMETVQYYEQMGGSCCILLSGNSRPHLKDTENAVAALARTLVKENGNPVYFIAAGPAVARISEISHSYHKASQLFSRRFRSEHSQEFFFEYSQNSNNEADTKKEAEIDQSAMHFWKQDRSFLLNFLSNGAKEDIDSFVGSMVADVGKQNLDSFLLRQYMLMDFYLTMTTYLQKLGYSSEVLQKAFGNYNETAEISDVAGMEDFLKKWLDKALGLRDETSENHSLSLTEEAKRYIQLHYAESDLSLGTVAKAVRISPNHLSRIFSQETRQTFIEYLTSVRMEKAKKLMHTSNLNSAEIGLKVGYNDPHYFYYIFKKSTNMTPKEYRASVSFSSPSGSEEA